MVYLPTGSSDLFLILSCITSDFLYLSFFPLHYSSLWRTDTIVFSKLNHFTLSNKPPISIKPPPPGGLNGGFTVLGFDLEDFVVLDMVTHLISFWETADSLNRCLYSLFSLRAKCWVRRGVGGVGEE